jgi:NifB/MoaA-like Fe-S oxidoreductase
MLTTPYEKLESCENYREALDKKNSKAEIVKGQLHKIKLRTDDSIGY